MGLWPDAYYFTFNMFPNLQFAGGKVCAMDRAKMLTGAMATMQCFDSGIDFGGLLASDLDGPTAPPAGSPNFVLALGAGPNELAFWKLHVDFATVGNSTFTGPTVIPVAAFTPMGSAVQPSGGSALDALSDRLMNRFAYRNFGDHESLVVSHAVTAEAAAASAGTSCARPAPRRRCSSKARTRRIAASAGRAASRWTSLEHRDGLSLSGDREPSVHYTARSERAPGTMGQGEAT
jgi:hypothetical protein